MRKGLDKIISLIKVHPLIKIVRGSLVELPTPTNIRSLWNFGSLLGLCLIIQVLTGLFLAIHYSGDTSIAFYSVNHIVRDVNFGWLLRILHANGARFFFICIYIHVGRGLYYGSYFFIHTWIVGVIILLMVMATAFLGYVLPWGQISFWGATVITNLFSAIPYIGGDLVQWIWGGFAVDNATLTRFFSLHFLLPFVIIGLRIVHLLFLHQTGRNNPLGINRNFDKISFHPYFSSKDLFGFFTIILFLLIICFYSPWLLGDPENFIPANPLVTPGLVEVLHQVRNLLVVVCCRVAGAHAGLHGGGQPLEVCDAVVTQLVEDGGQHLSDLLHLRVAGDGERVGLQRRLHLGVVEVDHCAVVLDHVHLLDSRDVAHGELFEGVL